MRKGDITKEHTDAIVNSSNENLDLSRGMCMFKKNKIETVTIMRNLQQQQQINLLVIRVKLNTAVKVALFILVGKVQKAIAIAAGESVQQECMALGEF